MFTAVVGFVMSTAIAIGGINACPTNHIRMSNYCGDQVYVEEWDVNGYGMAMNHQSYEISYDEWING